MWYVPLSFVTSHNEECGGFEMKPEKIRKKKTKKAKVSFVIAGILWIAVLFTWSQEYHGFHMYENGIPLWIILITGYIFPILSLPFIITGIYTWNTRDTLSKDEKIDQLQERVDKLETEEKEDSKEE